LCLLLAPAKGSRLSAYLSNRGLCARAHHQRQTVHGGRGARWSQDVVVLDDFIYGEPVLPGQ
jgi:hypothetical protein